MSDQPKPTTGEEKVSGGTRLDCGTFIPPKPTGEWTELKSKVFQALGEASMQWNPNPSGVFDSSGCERIGNELMSAINAALAAAQRQLDTCFKHELELDKQLASEREKFDNMMTAISHGLQKQLKRFNTTHPKPDVVKELERMRSELALPEIQQLRERIKELEDELSNAKCAEKASQLAAAQAANQNVLKWAKQVASDGNLISYQELKQQFASPSTTALDAAVAAAQQPLVDALTWYADESIYPLVATGHLKAVNALEKVKKGKV